MFNKKEYRGKYYQEHKKEEKERRRQRYLGDHEKELRRMKEWKKNNPEKVKEIDKRSYQKHREERLKKCKKYRENIPEKIKERKRKYYYSNHEEILKKARQYYKDHSKKMNEYAKENRNNHPEVRKQRRDEKLQYIQKYKISKGCQFCGYNENPRFLVFHHPDDNKEFDVSKSVPNEMSLEKIKKEMDKCILLCGVCHPKLHWKLRMEEKKKLDKN